MKFISLLEELQSQEENNGKIILAKCGAFFIAIGKNAIFLNQYK